MIVDWFEALAAAHPDRVSLVRFGETWERRPLLYAVITSPENHARLAEIQAATASLSDPRLASRAEAERIAESMPADRLAGVRRSRGRVLVCRGGDDGRRPADARRGGVADPSREPRRHHRPASEPRRARALRHMVRGARGERGESGPGGVRALPAVAGRALQPLSRRHEPGLDLGDAERVEGARGGLPRVAAAGLRRLPRDGIRVELFLSARRGSGEHEHRPADEASGSRRSAPRTRRRSPRGAGRSSSASTSTSSIPATAIRGPRCTAPSG